MALRKYTGLSPCAGATINVFNHGTLDAALLYQDADGAIVQANPFQADSRTGLYRFYADDAGRYDIQIDTDTIAPSVRVPDAEMYTIFSGVSPFRFATLIAEDSDGVQVEIIQKVF